MRSTVLSGITLAVSLIAGCQTKPVQYEVDAIFVPHSMFDERGRPRQYMVKITVTETNSQGESIETNADLLTLAGKVTEAKFEQLSTNRPPGVVSCSASITNEDNVAKVITSVTIMKDGKEAYSMKQNATLQQNSMPIRGIQPTR